MANQQAARREITLLLPTGKPYTGLFEKSGDYRYCAYCGDGEHVWALVCDDESSETHVVCRACGGGQHFSQSSNVFEDRVTRRKKGEDPCIVVYLQNGQQEGGNYDRPDAA